MNRSKACKWFDVCPLKMFYKQGALSKKWFEDYCRDDYLKCVRYKMEKEGAYHPDNMMPDGTIEKSLR